MYPAKNLQVFRNNIQCPKGHYEKEVVETKEKFKRMEKYRCLICGTTFWAENFRSPMDVSGRRKEKSGKKRR